MKRTNNYFCHTCNKASFATISELRAHYEAKHREKDDNDKKKI